MAFWTCPQNIDSKKRKSLFFTVEFGKIIEQMNLFKNIEEELLREGRMKLAAHSLKRSANSASQKRMPTCLR
jgi:hypothetical protein